MHVARGTHRSHVQHVHAYVSSLKTTGENTVNNYVKTTISFPHEETPATPEDAQLPPLGEMELSLVGGGTCGTPDVG